MKYRHPWIDPRVEQVRSAAVREYLLRRGWKPLPQEQANMEPYEAPGVEEAAVASVPLAEDGRDYVQRIIELVTEVSLAEGRYAGDVLSDMIGQPVPAPAGNGLTAIPSSVLPR